MATSLVEDTRPGFVDSREVSVVPPLLDRSELLWTMFGVALFVAFLCYVALT